MQRILTLVLAAVFLLSMTAHQLHPERPVADPSGNVVKWLAETDFDFGVLEQGSTSSVTFSFRNILGEPIVLQTVRTSCGCTAADWPQAPIEPDSTGTVLIEFDADRLGSFRKKITVFFDKQRKAEVLHISGEVE